ncbi:MAG: TerB family tellurite resistance protein [Myxococcales bacterium]|nr:TerB family tellurite resistance protein [Myxococcales bacterium]MCB9732660.1 TerB family tellurite resistance protein [Deltaproteobacteria bacterium]
MRWNTMRGDIPRVCALSDLLMAAALSDRKYEEDEWLVVASTLMKVLGVAELPPEVEDRMRGFDPDAHDLDATLAAIRPESDKDRQDLLKVVAKVVLADHEVHADERTYIDRVAGALGIDGATVEALLTT